MRLLMVMLLSLPCLAGAKGGYAPGEVIYPSQLDDALIVEFYQQWKQVYLSDACGDGRYFVDIRGDGNPAYGGSADDTITVSEAHGYGMLITVMMADFDADVQVIFDGMVSFFKDHPAESNPGLMAWNQIMGCVDAGADVGGNNSASDGDLDIAYALLLADARWGSGGAIDYRAEAELAMGAILAHDVSVDGSYLLIGDWAVADSGYGDMTRTSDFMQSHYQAFFAATGDARWQALHAATYRLIENIANPDTGLVPDFIVGLPDRPVAAEAYSLEGAYDGGYSWNAARYPFRIALDYLLFETPDAVAALRPLNDWIIAKTGGDPTAIYSGYWLDGARVTQSWPNEMPFVSMLAVSAMVSSDDQAWLDAIVAAMLTKPIADEDYFGNTLKMLALIALSGNWQAP